LFADRIRTAKNKQNLVPKISSSDISVKKMQKESKGGGVGYAV
jgi:hypothetical protein